MAINTYSTLVTAATEWLARENDATLVARIPDFIALAEAKFNRKLRCMQMEKRATAVFDTSSEEPEYVTLPAGFQSMRRIRLSSVDGKPQLAYKSQVQLDEYRQSVSDAAGVPRYFTVFGTEIEFAPTPDDDYTIEMVYRKNIDPLTSTSPTNWLLSLAPDLYLYGTLLESAPYIKDDGRIAVWSAGMADAVDGLNQLSADGQYGAQPLAVSASGATP